MWISICSMQKALADLLLAEGSRPVEIIYQNLDMDDFYEYKGE